MAKKIQTIFEIQDKYSKTMKKILESTSSAEKKINKASYATDKFNQMINKLKPPKDNVANGFDKIKNKADKANSSLGRLVKTALSLATIKAGIDIIDNTTLTNARLGLMNYGGQTDKELQSAIFASANRSRSDYSVTAANISKLGLLAKDSFGSNQELIAFSELLNKSFKVGGASTEEQNAGTYQLTQAMAAGKLQGDEFRSIMENAPLVADAIAKYMGKSKGELKELSSQGVITADIIKNAMFASANDIEEKFGKMPKTFSDHFTILKNKALEAFSPVFEKISNAINTQGFQDFMNTLVVGIQIAAEAVNWLIDAISWLGQMLGPFTPILLSVAGAFLVLTAYTHLATAAKWLFGKALSFVTTRAGLTTLAILAIVAILIYLWFTNDKVAYALLFLWDSLTIGAMTLALGVKTAFYAIILAGQYLWLGMQTVALGALGAWYAFQTGLEAVCVGILYIFQGLYNGVIGIVNGIITCLNHIPGVEIDTVEYGNFADKAMDNMINRVAKRNETLQSMANDMSETMASIETNRNKFAEDLNSSAIDIINKTAELNSTRNDRVKNRNNWINDLQEKANSIGDTGSLDLSSITNGKPIPTTSTGGKLDSVDNVGIEEEDLQYLKDFAEQEYINKYSTATLAPNVNISFGDVHENADVEAIGGRIAQILEEEIAEVAEGDYE